MHINTETDAPYDSVTIPLSERRGPITMGLLWITMVTAFPNVLMGFAWCKEGFTLSQVLLGALISSLMLAAYAIPASQLGARSGLSYTALSRSVFGRWGSILISLNLMLIFVGFYALMALLFTDELKSVFHLQISSALLAAILSVVMAVNNFFGFKGIANFARYVAAPMLIVWVFYSFCKAMSGCSPAVFTETPHKSLGLVITAISSFVIGYGVWGNEPDYWRFGKPKTVASVVPIAVSILIGLFIFPFTGWMVAKATGIAEYAAATSLMNEYSFAGIAGLSILVLGASYFATNDSNLFGLIEAGENLFKLRHRTWVCIWASICAIAAALMSITGAAKAMESIASLNCFLISTPTVIMLTEWFLSSKIFKSGSISSWRVPNLADLERIRWPAGLALLTGLTIGVATSGAIPGTESLHIGICAVQAWFAAVVVYVPLRIIEYRKSFSYYAASVGNSSSVTSPDEASIEVTMSKL